MNQLNQGGSYVIGADGKVERTDDEQDATKNDVAQIAEQSPAPVQPVQPKAKGGA